MNSFSFFWTVDLTITEHESILSLFSVSFVVKKKPDTIYSYRENHSDWLSVTHLRSFKLHMYMYILSTKLSVCVGIDTMNIKWNFAFFYNKYLRKKKRNKQKTQKTKQTFKQTNNLWSRSKLNVLVETMFQWNISLESSLYPFAEFWWILVKICIDIFFSICSETF